ncbi:heterogeneous nuclear ribonucleoprotein 1-like [Canna indica]|uniref:Heterogeneous nuclear ribonucleoprotein 1-like n=1 Tax=Canna indica TaxID=4628 RepID=A0AAQ3K8K0_9LILI|nr:heterogeneous nuclear ribonucleoprotein 1-like [Canna indica]
MQSDHGKLFIGGISWDTNEDSLREYFRNYGEVVEAVIMKDRATGRARGFGFIVFADPAVAERVVMEKHEIDGRMVEAKKAVPRDDQHTLNRSNNSIHGSPGPGRTKKIFVGGLPSTITENEFKKYFDQFGTITDVVVMYDHNTQRPRGFGFITYDSEEAVDKVLFKTFHELNGKTVEVKKAVPKELSPGPNIRSPSGGYNYGMNRVNNFLNGYTQGLNPSSISGFGMRMESRLGTPTSTRNDFPSFIPGFGMGINYEPSLIPSFGGNSSISNSIGYGRGLNSYYNGNSTRYSIPIGYGGSSANTNPDINLMTRNAWGSGSVSYNTSSSSYNAFTTSGLRGLAGFGNINWGNATPMSAQVGGSASSYVNGNLSYADGDNNFDLGGGNFGRSIGPSATKTSLTPLNGGFEGTYEDLYGGSSVYGDSTWQSSSSELDGTDPFGHRLGNLGTNIINKESSGYLGNYGVTNRQPDRGIAT